MTVNTVETLSARLTALTAKVALLKTSEGDADFGEFGQRAGFAKKLVNWLEANKDDLKGNAGAKGAPGNVGWHGERGLAGKKGAQGITGQRGEDGPQGNPGKPGSPPPSVQYYPNPTIAIDDTLVHPTVTIAQRSGDYLYVDGKAISPTYLDIEIKMPKFKIKAV